MKVLISNGSYKFHLAPLAAEMATRGLLAGFLAAGWPVGWQKKLATFLNSNPEWKRFLDRSEEIPDCSVRSSPETELVLKIGDAVRPYSKSLQQRIHSLAFKLYSRIASKALLKLRPDIYHYRCCYGGSSVKTARKMNIPLLCDHSVAHPQVADFMVSNCGAYPPQKTDTICWPLSRQAEQDLNRAEHVLVNSQFVKDTCIHAGMNAEQIHVVYLGVDDKFFDAIPFFDAEQVRSRKPSLLFAGGWQERKGIRTLIESLLGEDTPWSLDVIAAVDPDLEKDNLSRSFFSDERVNRIGSLPRAQLAAKMTDYKIFVFPSYCEGSARVIFEAMACGCYIITTPNAGSIVQDGIHGKIVPPGNPESLREAIKYALNNQCEVEGIGLQNAQLIARNYRQRHYGDNVQLVYNSIVNRHGVKN